MDGSLNPQEDPLDRLFFFSRRRRHTRFACDWSSDVCSSDLSPVLETPGPACINAGPGVSKTGDEVTISAINRNFPGRSGPGQLYLANPYTVAASAIAGDRKSVV